MLRRHPLSSLTMLTLIVALGVSAAAAAPASPMGKPGDAAATPEKPFGEWKKITKDAELKKGFFNLHKKRDVLYLELTKEQLNQPFLYVVSTTRGIGSNFLLGGLPLDDRMLQFERVGDRIMLYEVNTRFVTPKDTPIDKARDNSIPNSVLASFKIETEHDSTKAVLIDIGSMLVGDVTDLSEAMKGALNNVSVRFDKERSALTQIKNFPDNSEIEALLTYSPNDRSKLLLESVPDNRYIPVTVHYSFSRLPVDPMMPRWADNRVGYFMGAKKDFARDDKENFWLRYVNRWRLDKKDSTAAVSEVVKPIVYYMDWTIPDKFRPWVKEGVEMWQKAFEAAGLKNAIIAMDPPKDDPDWDAEDVRYSTIRWITSNEPSFGAIGPSRIDPRTGQIFDSDILFEASMFQSYANNYRRFAGPGELANSILPQSLLESLPAGMALEHLCMAGDAMQGAAAMQNMSLLMDGKLEPGSPVPDVFLKAAVQWAVMHEVGHALGLRHNFRSSTSTPIDKLHDPTWTHQNGLYSSVMEYPTPNIDHSRLKQGEWWTTTPGTYDMWAIRYGYQPTGAKTSDEDYKAMRKVADESLLPGHEYSTDEDTYPADAPDPRSNIYDLGSDPLQYAKERTAYVAKLWRSPSFEERIVGSTGDLTALRRAMDSALQQYGIASGMAVKYLGGSYISRVERGQPSEKDPVVPVAAAKQREALDFLSTRVWAADAFAVPGKLLQRLAPNRWSQWGMGAGTFAGRHDYDFNDKVLAIQATLLNASTSPALLTRMREAESRSPEAYRLSEHFDRLTRAIWGEVAGANPAGMKALEGTNTRREVQRAFVDRMGAMVASPPAGAPDDARALARLSLSRVDGRCARALASPAPMGDNTRAHLLETRARIKRSLEAGRDVDAGGGGARGLSGTMNATQH